MLPTTADETAASLASWVVKSQLEARAETLASKHQTGQTPLYYARLSWDRPELFESERLSGPDEVTLPGEGYVRQCLNSKGSHLRGLRSEVIRCCHRRASELSRTRSLGDKAQPRPVATLTVMLGESSYAVFLPRTLDQQRSTCLLHLDRRLGVAWGCYVTLPQTMGEQSILSS